MKILKPTMSGVFSASDTWGSICTDNDLVVKETTELERYYRSIIQALVYVAPDARLRIGMFDWENSWKNYELECVRDGDELVLSVAHKERHDHKASFDDLMKRAVGEG